MVGGKGEGVGLDSSASAARSDRPPSGGSVSSLVEGLPQAFDAAAFAVGPFEVAAFEQAKAIVGRLGQGLGPLGLADEDPDGSGVPFPKAALPHAVAE